MFDTFCQHWPEANGFILVENVERFMQIGKGRRMVRQHFYNRSRHMNLIELEKSIVFPFVSWVFFLSVCVFWLAKRRRVNKWVLAGVSLSNL